VSASKAGFFVGIGIVNADRYLLFQEVSRLGAAFPLEGEPFLINLELVVDGRGTYLQ